MPPGDDAGQEGSGRRRLAGLRQGRRQQRAAAEPELVPRVRQPGPRLAQQEQRVADPASGEGGVPGDDQPHQPGRAGQVGRRGPHPPGLVVSPVRCPGEAVPQHLQVREPEPGNDGGHPVGGEPTDDRGLVEQLGLPGDGGRRGHRGGDHDAGQVVGQILAQQLRTAGEHRARARRPRRPATRVIAATRCGAAPVASAAASAWRASSSRAIVRTQVAGAVQLRHRPRPVVRCALDEVGEDRLGLVAAAEPGQGCGVHQPGDGVAGGGGRAGQPLGQRQVVHPRRRLGGLQEQRGIRGQVGVEGEHGPGDRVRRRVQGLRHPAAQAARPQGAHGGAADLAVQRVRQPGDQPVGAHQAPVLGLLEVRRRGQRGQRRHRHRLGQRDQVHDVLHPRREAADLALEEVGQLRGDRRLAGPPPDPGRRGEPARRHLPGQQVPQEQRAALGQGPQPVRGGRLDRTAEHPGDQAGGLGDVQRGQVQAREVVVLPQRRHRVGRRLPGPERDHDRCQPPYDHAVQHDRGVLVEQVRVVDGQHQRPLPGELVQRPADGLGGVAGRDVEQAGERTEGQGPGGRAAVGPDDGRTPAPGNRQRLAGEPGLAHPGRARHHDPRRTGPDRRRDPAQLLVPAGERPRPLHARQASEPRFE